MREKASKRLPFPPFVSAAKRWSSDVNSKGTSIFADCESLVRKMLVRDPERRFSVANIKRHRWMQAEVPAEEANAGLSAEMKPQERARLGRRCERPVDENVLKIMAELGIDTSVTREVYKDLGNVCMHK